MARKPRTQELWDRLIAAFKEHPGNFSYASRFAQCDPRTAKAAWEQGWPEQNKSAIQQLLADNRKAARAERMLAVERARRERQERGKLAQQDALDTIKQEAILVRNMRTNAIAANTVVVRLMQAAIPLASRLASSLETTTLTPREAIDVLRGVIYVARNTTVVSAEVLAAERTRLGEPIDPDKYREDGDVAEMDVEDALADLVSLRQTIEEAEKRGWADLSDLSDEELDDLEAGGEGDDEDDE